MKKILFFFTLVFLSIVSLKAQSSNDYVGAIKLNDTSVITYRLKFKISDGEVSGYSLTDFNGEHETKSAIKGKYDSDKKLFSFHEDGIIYTKSPVSENDFCNIYFMPTKFEVGKSKYIKGEFYGKFDDGTKCIDGEIYLNAVERVEERIEKVSKKINKSRKVHDSIKEQFNNLKILDTLNLNVLKKDEITSVFTKSKSVKFMIYDGGQVDADAVTILKDGKIVLLNHKISDKKEIFEFPISKAKTRITVIAESMGTIGTTTATIEILDNENTIRTVTSLNKGEKTEIEVLRKTR